MGRSDHLYPARRAIGIVVEGARSLLLEVVEQRPLLLQQPGQRLIGAVPPAVGEPYQHAPPVAGVRQPLDEVFQYED